MNVHNKLLESCLLREKQIIGDPNCDPPIQPLIPVSKSGWWAGVKSGRYPKPIKLGPRTSVWRSQDILDLLLSRPQQDTSET
jgi:prophage regulatory protein